jgi:hypothetical protein
MMFNNAKEESAYFEQEAFDEAVAKEAERKTDEMLENLEVDTLDIPQNKDGSRALSINGIDFGIDVAHIDILKHLCITALQEVDDERMYEANELDQQWADQYREDEEPNPYSGTYSEI